MNKTLKSFLQVFLPFFLIIYIATHGILSGYFEQDEWLGIANVMNSYNLPWWNIFIPGQIHFSPLGVLFWTSLYKIFKLQAQYYFLIELIVHTACATLVFILTKQLTKNKYIALITALLFLLNGRAHQAFTHLAIFHTTDSSMLCILLFFVYLASNKDKILSLKKTIVLLLLFLAAVFFREEGFIIVPIFVTYLICIDRGKLNKKNVKYFGLLLFGLIALVVGRFFAQSLYTEPIPTQYQITGRSAEYNIVTLPIKFVVQNLIYSERIAVFFVNYHEKIYPGMVKNIYLDAAPLMDAAFFYIFGVIAFLSAVWMWLVRPKHIGALFMFLFAWIFSNALMLAFVGRPIFVVEPRYLYFSSFPVFCFISIFAYTLFNFKNKSFLFNFVKKLFVIVLLVSLFLTSFQEIRFAVNNEIKLAHAKKIVLSNLRQIHPTLSNDSIIYIQCKVKCYRNGELGIPFENVLPFSSGPGMIILVTYAVGYEREWGPFFTKEFLFHTFSEDYKKIGDRGFGYFTTKSKLENTLKKNKLSKNIVVALELDEKDYTFRDISKKFVKTLDVK